MSAFKKRRLEGSAPSLGVATSKKARPSKVEKSTSKKPTAKPAPPPEPESSSEDDEAEGVGEEETSANGHRAEQSPIVGEEEPIVADEAKKTFADLGVREELCDSTLR